MTNKEFSEKIMPDLKKLYNNIHSVFYISPEEFKDIIVNILKLDKKGIFYHRLITPNRMIKCFEKENLLALRDYFSSLNLDLDTMIDTIIYIPEILFFADKLDSIFPIFKAKDFKGIALINNGEYKAYDYIDISDNDKFYNYMYNKDYDNPKNVRKEILYEDDTIVESMLEMLSRKDVMDYYGINEKSSLKEKFYALASQYNKRNYYFYKERNPLIEKKAIASTRTDSKYHCDLCGRGLDDPEDLIAHHIIPVSKGGADEIYNIVCLCNRCNNLLKPHRNDDKYRSLLIMALKERLKKTNPEYINKVNNYFEYIESKEELIRRQKNH